AEIYARIPDFGGFLVKANSEGQPGPQDFGRTHADGANMLAEVLAPHGGVVMWRAFVYSHAEPDGRHQQAYTELVRLDGSFPNSVMVQVQTRAIDSQPPEPDHPPCSAMPKTALKMKFEVTKEYLGSATPRVDRGPMYEEVWRADSHAAGPGSTAAKVV